MPWMELARAEREDFAAFLETLSSEQWQAPTLCHKWNVREVAARAISFDELDPVELVRRFMSGLLIVDRINDVGWRWTSRGMRRPSAERGAPAVCGSWPPTATGHTAAAKRCELARLC